MDKPLLNDAKEFPDDKVLAKYLGRSKIAWDELLNLISSTDSNLEMVWNYYRDGNAWLCKLTNKKKTVCWISIWDKFFKVGFYFTEKNDHDIAGLKIETELKKSYLANKSIGKLKPLTIEVKSKKPLKDVVELIEYKSQLK